ncbi:uncharacterized protein LOC142544789 [Primulina tabacum]|uniref:uncharacterized protein LOC142544789 n=1 Tax=Primulina tabacum TaxID=48773 RepID=UPI003F59DB42
MEKLLNPYDQENMRKAMLRHEETFREQVNELHRLYRTQKILMKDLARLQRDGASHPSWNIDSRARKFVEPGNRAGEYNFTEAGEDGRVLEDEDDRSTDLELTLGPRSYYQRKVKAAELGTDVSGFGPGFSTSSSSGSTSCMKRTKEGFSSQQNQERLDNSHCVFQVLSLNMT